MKTAGSSREVFRNPDFRRLWQGAQISNLGGLIQAVGAAWMMTTLTQSESMVALVQASQTMPIMLFALSAGVFADSFDRRKVMLAAQSFMLAAAVALALLTVLGGLTAGLLLGFTFLIGCGTALHNPSWQASVGDIVPRQDVPTAVALNAMGFNIVRGVGPAAGGVIVAVGGAAAAFSINVLSYIALLWALWKWRPVREPRRLPREPFGAALVAGLRYVSMSPNLLRVISRTAIFGTSAVSVQALLPVIVQDKLGGGAVVYGALLGFFGVGAVAGAFLSPRIRARFSNEAIARACCTGFALGTLVVAFSTVIAITALALVFSGACWLMMMSLSNATVQMSAPRWVVGRALAMYQTGAFGGMAVGSWIWGTLAETYSLSTSLVASALVLFAAALLGRVAPFPDFEGLDLTPLDRFREPAVNLDLRDRSGPIKIMVFYSIAEADRPEFLRLIDLRRRIRIRDGARHWTLSRDLEMPDQWVESYLVPTWTEYLRQHARRTQTDGVLNDQISRLHRGERPQKVMRLLERPSF